MEVNLEVCKAVAIQHGLPLQFVVKEFHLFDVLSQIASVIAQENPKLVFKGGTALNKVYLKKGQRFSEDLDFDIEGQDPAVFSKALAEKIKGYTISGMRKVRKTVQFYCAYESPLGGKDHVRVDISGKKIITSAPPQLMTATSEISHASVSGLRVYSFEDLVARKMNALCSRTEGKDAYDIYTSLPMCGAMKKSLKAMLESEEKSQSPEKFLEETIEAVKKADFRRLRNYTNPFIPLPSRPADWVEMKNDLVIKLEGLKL